MSDANGTYLTKCCDHCSTVLYDCVKVCEVSMPYIVYPDCQESQYKVQPQVKQPEDISELKVTI